MLAMKNIDDKAVEKALENLRSTRRLKPIVALIGLVFLIVGCAAAWLLHEYVENPFSGESPTEVPYTITVLMVMFLVNMVGALTLLPALASYLLPRGAPK